MINDKISQIESNQENGLQMQNELKKKRARIRK